MDSSSSGWTPPDHGWAPPDPAVGPSEHPDEGRHSDEPALPAESAGPGGWAAGVSNGEAAMPAPAGIVGPPPPYAPAQPPPYGPPGPHGRPGPYGWPYPYGHPVPFAYPGPPAPYGFAGPWPYSPPPRVAAAPAGSPYHRLARTPLHRWWRPLVGTLFLAATAVVAVILLVAGAMIIYAITSGDLPRRSRQGNELFPNATADLALQLAVLGVLTPIVLIIARLAQRRPMGSLTSVTGRLRWGWLLLCGGLAVGMMVVSIAMSYALATLTNEAPEPLGWSGWDTFAVPAIVIVVLVPFQAAAEEYVFRGWLLQGIAACTLESRTGRIGRAFSTVFRTPWPAILISAAVFTSGHEYTGLAMLDIFIFGTVAGWLAVKTGGLEATIAMHTVNNLVAFLLPAAAGNVAGSLNQGGAPWQSVVSDVVPMALFAAVVVMLVRRRGVQTVTPVGNRRDQRSASPLLERE